MSELRQDRTTGGWVIVAPHRGRRPRSHSHAPEAKAPARAPFDPACPFCPGNEAQLPGLVGETPTAEAPGWRLRVVPNKFPIAQAMQPIAEPVGRVVRAAAGHHEVIIESPRHDADPAAMSAQDLAAVAGLYRERARVLFARDGIQSVVLFRNRGRSAGASLAHPHAQIVALNHVPPRIATMGDWMKRYHAEHGACAMCAELADERKAGTRIVDENEHFVALVPFAAAHPYETWLAPLQHQASFPAMGDAALPGFADMLGRILRRLRAALDDPSYNLLVETAPRTDTAAPHWHWRARIVPDVATWGGFEMATGLPINPSNPDGDAALLRAAKADG